ncbi:PAS domain S-box protein [Janthinobacterium fluminis]|uniref:histidine kinase n=1 Tax=Janthinobacterium fluminis TaxID=2987524 RepID=A0ABT5K3N4_9BURK|nr:PAS domain S-box protein [Janthinobacterium fluminis]MDC8759587.1 PAS domain S-box protein [Janthinobacterium fluminis]
MDQAENSQREAGGLSIDSFELPLGVVGVDGRLLRANPALAALTGPLPAAGVLLAELLPVADCRDFLAQARSGGKRHQLATLLRGATSRQPVYLRWLPTAPGVPWIFSVCPMAGLDQAFAGRERALLEYQAIMKHAPLGVVFTCSRRIVRYNDEFARLFGFDGDSGVGQLASTLYASAATFDEVGRHAYPTLLSRGSFHDEIRFRRRDGATFWGGAWGFLANPADPEQGTIWIISDISVRKSAESVLRASLFEWEEIFNKATIGIGVTRGRTILRCNAHVAATLGYTADELEGTPTSTIFPTPESYEATRRLANPLLIAGRPYETERELRRRDGSLVWCHVCAKTLDPARPESGTVWIVDDLTEARAAQERLHSTLRDYQGVLNNASLGIVLTAGRAIQRYNPAFSAMFGYAGDSAVGLQGRALYRSDAEYAELGKLVGPALAAGKPVQCEVYLRRRDGSDFWGNLSGYLADPDEPARGTWWIIEDRSAFKQAQQALEGNYAELKEAHRQLEAAQAQLLQSEKMASIGQLAAGVAHEINNPIGFVNSNLGTLGMYVGQLLDVVGAYEEALDGVAMPAPSAQRIAGARTAADIDYLREDVAALLQESQEGLARVRNIVQDLKDFSHVDEGEWQEVDLNAGFRSTLNMVRNELKYKAEVSLELGELPPVQCNPAQINQVLMNLLVNAAHAIERQGRIVLRSGVEGEWVWLEVEDNGCGIAPEVQARIFDPFFTTKPVGKGTGLGLSVSYGIVNRHGGHFDMASTPGQGTRFRFWLPLAPPAPA